MISTQKSYKIHFGDEKKTPRENPNEQFNEEIPTDNVNCFEEFTFLDYNSSSTIEYLKEYFLTTFSQKYKRYNFCKCVLSVFYKKSNKYFLLSRDVKKKLSDFKYKELFLIKTNTLCDCELKMYKTYMNMEKFDVITKLKEVSEKANDLEEESNLKLEEYQKKLEKLQKELEETQKKCKELQKENDALTKKEELEQNSTMEKFYDIIVDIKSIKGINKEGWPIKFSEEGKKKYEEYKKLDSIILGVLGNNNKGKSFLLNKLSKIPLISGNGIHTEGLSVKYPELEEYKGRKLILLDSAGLETPVLKSDDNIKEENEKEREKEELVDKEKEQNKEFKENARDKIMTELFLQNFIIEVSNILLVVVGHLTYSEQLLINKIKVESKRRNKNMIFIIHNLQLFRKKSQVEGYIKNTLLKCSTFNLKKRTWISTRKDEHKKEENKNEIKEEDININNNEPKKHIVNIVNDENVKDESKLNNVHFTEILNYEGKNKLYIYHLILACEGSEAGDIYNQYAYDFIEHVYNVIPEPKQFDILEKITEQFKAQSSNFFHDTIEKIPFNKNFIEEKRIKLEKEEDLVLKKCYTDELGFSSFKTGDFEPKFNYFKPDENTLEIRVEVPGNKTCDVFHRIIGDETIITVKGEKLKDSVPKKPEDDLRNIREFSKFELNIPLKVEEFEIKSTKPKEGFPKWVSGVCLIQYELATKAEKTETKEEQL